MAKKDVFGAGWLKDLNDNFDQMPTDFLTFVGSSGSTSGSGGCALTGVVAGDLVLSVTGISGSAIAGDQSDLFETEITEDDYIQQESTDDLSENTYGALIQRKS